MNDIKRLLSAALNEENSPMPPTFDPGDDIGRGHRHLARRRAAIAGGVAVAAILVGGGAAAVLGTSDSSAPVAVAQNTAPVTTPATSEPPAAPVNQQVTLVAYTGKQPKGYKVSQVPDGWEIQGGREASLVIAPKDAENKDIDVFVDKLSVLSTSSDAPPESLTQGQKVPFGDGNTGYYREPGDGYQIFTYQDKSSGRWVDVQVPPSLHWDADRIGEFAAGVTVVGGAGDSHG